MIDTIIFDLDGTLIDSPKIIIEGFLYTIKLHTKDIIITEHDKTNILGQTLEKAFEKYANNEEHYKMLADTFRMHTKEKILNELEAYENARDVLEYLKEKKYKLAIVTSKIRYAVDESLVSSNLNDIFDVIIAYDDTEKHKPAADPILRAIKMLDSKVEHTIYIGDHENDIVAGKNAKTKTGLVKFSYRYLEAIKENPDYVFANLNELKKIFKGVE